MLAYIDGFVAVILGLLCATPVLSSQSSNYFMDNGECKCVPYTKACFVEVIDVSVQPSFHAKTMTCWYGTRLCCDKSSPADSRNGKQMDFLRGYVFRINSFLAKHNRHTTPMDNKTEDEYGYSRQKLKSKMTDRGPKNLKNLGIRTTIPSAVISTTENTKMMKTTESVKQRKPKLLLRPTDLQYTSKRILSIPGGHTMNLVENIRENFSTVVNKTENDNGASIQRLKSKMTDRGPKNPKNLGIRTSIPSAYTSTTESIKEMGTTESVKQRKPKLLLRPSDLQYTSVKILSPPGGDSMNLDENSRENFSRGKKLFENVYVDEEGKLVFRSNENKGNRNLSAENSTEREQYRNASTSEGSSETDSHRISIQSILQNIKNVSLENLANYLGTINVPNSDKMLVKFLFNTFHQFTEHSNKDNMSNCTGTERKCTGGQTDFEHGNFQKQNSTPVHQVSPAKLGNTHLNFAANAFSKNNHSSSTDATTDLPLTNGNTLTPEVISYFKGIDLASETSSVLEGALVSKIHKLSFFSESTSKPSSMTVLSNLSPVSYSCTTEAVPVLTLIGSGEHNMVTKFRNFRVPVPQSYSSVILSPSKTADELRRLSDRKSHLPFGYTSVTVKDVPSLMVVTEVTHSLDFLIPTLGYESLTFNTILPAHLYSPVKLSSEISNFYSSVQIMTSMYILASNEVLNSQILTPLLGLQTSLVTAVSPVFTSASKVFLYTQKLTPPSLKNPLITTVSPVFTFASEEVSYIQTLTPPKSSKTFLITEVYPVFTLASRVISYNQNLTPRGRKTTLITAVSPVFTFSSEGLLFIKNVTSLKRLKPSIIATASPEVFPLTQILTPPISLKTSLITAVSTLSALESKVSLTTRNLTSSVSLYSTLITAVSPLLTVASKVFFNTQNLTTPVSLITPLIPAPFWNPASLNLSKGAGDGNVTQTSPLISTTVETAVHKVFPKPDSAFRGVGTSELMSINSESHSHSKIIAYKRLGPLITNSVKLHTGSLFYAKSSVLSVVIKNKIPTTTVHVDFSPPNEVRRLATTSLYLTDMLKDHGSNSALSSVLHSLAGKYSTYTNLKNTIGTHTNRLMHSTETLTSYIQKSRQNTYFKSKPSIFANKVGPYTSTLYSHFTLSIKEVSFSKVSEIGKDPFKSTAKSTGTHRKYYRYTITSFGSKQSTLKPSESLTLGLVSTSHIPQLKASKPRKLTKKGKETETYLDPPSVYIKPSLASEMEFRAFLHSVGEERLNKSKTGKDEGSGVWGWLFG